MDRAATEAIASLAFVTALLGRPAEAIALAERGLILARDHGLADREVRCLNARGAAVLLQGNIEGYTDFMRALTRALEAGLGHESAMAYHNLAELQLQGVGTASSSEMNERGLDLAERRGLTLAADWLRANRVQLFFEAGRWDEALTIADAVIASEARSGTRPGGHDVRGVVGANPRLARRPRPRDPADGHVPAACPPARRDPAGRSGVDRRRPDRDRVRTEPTRAPRMRRSTAS